MTDWGDRPPGEHADTSWVSLMANEDAGKVGGFCNGSAYPNLRLSLNFEIFFISLNFLSERALQNAIILYALVLIYISFGMPGHP